jgi:hypothetical protein
VYGTTHTVSFDDLAQTGWGTPATFVPAEVLYIQFSFGPGVTFDISVDDLVLQWTPTLEGSSSPSLNWPRVPEPRGAGICYKQGP